MQSKRERHKESWKSQTLFLFSSSLLSLFSLVAMCLNPWDCVDRLLKAVVSFQSRLRLHLLFKERKGEKEREESQARNKREQDETRKVSEKSKASQKKRGEEMKQEKEERWDLDKARVEKERGRYKKVEGREEIRKDKRKDNQRDNKMTQDENPGR